MGTAGRVHISRESSLREGLGGAGREGTVTSCRKIQVLEGSQEEGVLDLSFEGWGENLLGSREGSGDLCSRWGQPPTLRKGGKQERVRCVAGGRVDRAEEHTAGSGRGWASLRWDFIQADVGEPQEIREQESRQ